MSMSCPAQTALTDNELNQTLLPILCCNLIHDLAFPNKNALYHKLLFEKLEFL